MKPERMLIIDDEIHIVELIRFKPKKHQDMESRYCI